MPKPNSSKILHPLFTKHLSNLRKSNKPHLSLRNIALEAGVAGRTDENKFVRFIDADASHLKGIKNHQIPMKYRYLLRGVNQNKK